MSAPGSPDPLFRFVQVELPWALGPPDGRYLLRRPQDPPEAPAAHVLVLATLGAPERRRRFARKERQPEPEPEPTPVTTGRATVIDAAPLPDPAGAGDWLRRAGSEVVEEALTVLNRALHAYRLVTADPSVGPIARAQTLVIRAGYGGGEQVADGLWSDARELPESAPRTRRLKVLQPQARLAAVLGGRERALVCEELVLRARLDLDHGRQREAALQLLVALDAAIAELSNDPKALALAERVSELRQRREPVGTAAQTALSGPLDPDQLQIIAHTASRIEAALRARAVANA